MAKQLKCKFHKYNAADKSYDDLLPQTSGDQIINFTKILVDTVYPVGSIFQTTTEDDPNTLWPGTTWEKMEAGRVLISAGTYTEGEGDAAQTYTYNLGDKGGEAKHQLTTEELPSHEHAVSSDNGHSHAYNIPQNNDGLAKPEDGSDSRRVTIRFSTENTSLSGIHSHSLTKAGGDKLHENRPPYETIMCWKRLD